MRASANTFIVELPLVTGDEERRILSKTFSFARTLYNATLSQALGVSNACVKMLVGVKLARCTKGLNEIRSFENSTTNTI